MRPLKRSNNTLRHPNLASKNLLKQTDIPVECFAVDTARPPAEDPSEPEKKYHGKRHEVNEKMAKLNAVEK
jgi:hypothetical protein